MMVLIAGVVMVAFSVTAMVGAHQVGEGKIARAGFAAGGMFFIGLSLILQSIL